MRVGRRRVKTRTQCHNDAFCGAKHQVLPSSLAGGGDADNAATHWHEMSQLNIHIWLFCDEAHRNIAGVLSPVHCALLRSPGQITAPLTDVWSERRSGDLTAGAVKDRSGQTAHPHIFPKSVKLTNVLMGSVLCVVAGPVQGSG